MNRPSYQKIIRPQYCCLCWIAVALAALSSSCANAGPQAANLSRVQWQQSDLIIRDSADAAAPEYDLLAVYAQRQISSQNGSSTSRNGMQTIFPYLRPSTLTIRLDLLDISPLDTAGYAIALDTAPGGSTSIITENDVDIAWDILITIPPAGRITAVGADRREIKYLRLNVWRDPTFDTITLSFRFSALSIPVYDMVQIQAFSLSHSGNQIEDRTAPKQVSGDPPEPTYYRLVFQNAFPVYTPAQALRRWDGAHTGPLGGRHGLYNLLRIARNYSIPISFTDLGHPVSLSALDYVQGIDFVSQLHSVGSIHYLSYQLSELSEDHPVVAIENKISQVQDQPVPDGLSLETRRKFANAIGETVILSGDLPQSTWGVPEYARSAFSYIRAHPWMLSMDGTEFFANGNPLHNSSQSLGEKDGYSDLLNLMAPGPELAYGQALRYGPVSPHPGTLNELRSVYAHELGVLSEAVEWQEQPYTGATCNQQIDLQTPPFCVLASERVFALLDPRTGGMNFLFVKNRGEIHQLIGPGWQFSFGSSDASIWDLAAGPFADPDAIPGAFARRNVSLTANITPEQITLSDSNHRIVYSLLPSGIRSDFTGNDYAQTSIPLALDPWHRFSKGWGQKYNPSSLPNGYRWEISEVAAMTVKSNAALSLEAFTDSQELMGAGENPNLEFPPGHYLPFPLALVHLDPRDSTWVKIELAI